MVKRPSERVKSTRMRENSTPGGCAAAAAAARAATRSSAASPRTAKSRMLRMPSCGACVGARRIERHPHLAADDLGIDVGEAEERARIVGLDEDDLAPVVPRPRRSPISGVSRPSLALSAKLVMAPARRDSRRSRPRSVSPWKPTTAPSLMSRSISLSCFCLRLLAAPPHRRLDEAAAVVDLAAHRHPQRAVRPALGLQRRLVAVGQAEDREIRRHDVAGSVELDRALDRSAGRFDHEVLEPGRPRPC